MMLDPLPIPKIPSGDDRATIACPVCGDHFEPSGRRKFCSDTCRRRAWKRQHRKSQLQVPLPTPGQPRKPISIYECDDCGNRSLGDQRCADCRTFMRRVGFGGCCPHCDELVAVTDLFDGEVVHQG